MAGHGVSRGRLQPPVGWAAVAGGGTIAGIGFTVALLVATLAFDGAELEEAKLGILSAAFAAAVVTSVLFRATALLPRRTRIRALLGTSEPLVDLYVDFDPERDHVRGPVDAPVTVVEYGDFECAYCGQAEPVVRELLREFGDVAYVWRHLPLTEVHPHAQIAAETAEAAADQGAFWEMHDLLLDHQDALRPDELVGYAKQLGLDPDRFTTALRDTPAPGGSQRTSMARSSAASPAPPRSSSTADAATAPMTSPRCRQPSVPPVHGRHWRQRRRIDGPVLEIAFAPAAAVAVAAGLAVELRLFAPGRAPGKRCPARASSSRSMPSRSSASGCRDASTPSTKERERIRARSPIFLTAAIALAGVLTSGRLVWPPAAFAFGYGWVQDSA